MTGGNRQVPETDFSSLFSLYILPKGETNRPPMSDILWLELIDLHNKKVNGYWSFSRNLKFSPYKQHPDIFSVNDCRQREMSFRKKKKKRWVHLIASLSSYPKLMCRKALHLPYYLIFKEAITEGRSLTTLLHSSRVKHWQSSFHKCIIVYLNRNSYPFFSKSKVASVWKV